MMAERTLGRYVIQDEIGHGVMGTVYRAYDPALARVVALKTVRPGAAAPPTQREAFEKRFLAEARGAASLSHPAIVIVHDVGRDAATRTLYIAFEYLEGQTLADRLADGPLPWREALRVTGRLAEALQHAHAKGIVHRDVKPANVMILPSGEPKIMDFGIARIPFSELTAAGQLFGTPSYMSPEQAVGESVDGRSDVFSLGAVCYLMLTGRSAFAGDTLADVLARIQHKQPAAPTSLVAGIPPAVDEVVATALAKDRAARYAEARELAEDVAAILEGRDPPHCRSKPAAQCAQRTIPPGATAAAGTLTSPAARSTAARAVASSSPGSRRTALATGAVAGALLLLIVAAVFVATRHPTGAMLPALPLARPGQLAFSLDHDLASGTVRIWIDEDLVLERTLSGAVKKKVLFYTARRGRLQETVDVRPGEHSVRVQVTGKDVSVEGSVRGVFESGIVRRLDAHCGGLLSKRIELVWRN